DRYARGGSAPHSDRYLGAPAPRPLSITSRTRWRGLSPTPRGTDVFGQALLDWSNGGTTPEVVERDDGFFDVGAGPEVYLSGVRGWPPAERQAIRLVTGRVLDVGCGAG